MNSFKITLLSVVLGFATAVKADDSIKATGYVFTGKDNAVAKVACGGKTDKCMVKLDKISKEYDGKAVYLTPDRNGASEWHLTAPKIGRFATLYVADGKPYSLTVWKTTSGKRLDLKLDDLKTEAFDASAFYKTSLSEQ